MQPCSTNHPFQEKHTADWTHHLHTPQGLPPPHDNCSSSNSSICMVLMTVARSDDTTSGKKNKTVPLKWIFISSSEKKNLTMKKKNILLHADPADSVIKGRADDG